MIIECGHCGAPLDVQPKDRVVKCNYCDQSNQVGSRRTVAFETPAGWRPPEQWMPPAYAAANSGQALKYHQVRRRSSAGAMVVFVVLAVIGIGVAAGGVMFGGVLTAAKQVTDTRRTVDDAVNQANEAIEQALAQASAVTEQAGRVGAGNPAARLSLLTSAGVQEALAAYKQALGVSQLQAMRLTFHDQHSSIRVQSPKNPQHVDGYDYILRAVRGPDPVRLSSREKKDLKAQLFDPETIALSELDQLRQKAIGELAYERANITHVIVERNRGKTEILVYGKNERESGYVRFDAKGKVVRVYR